MAQTITTEDPRVAAAGTAQPDALTQGLYGPGFQPASAAARESKVGDAIKSRMPDLVKGAGFVGHGANTPLSDYTDIMNRSAEAALSVRATTYGAFANRRGTVASLNQGWLNDFGALKTALTQPSALDVMGDMISALVPGGAEAVKSYIGKSFTAGNLGIGSVSGLTPFNLLAPSRLIYPVYTVSY